MRCLVITLEIVVGEKMEGWVEKGNQWSTIHFSYLDRAFSPKGGDVYRQFLASSTRVLPCTNMNIWVPVCAHIWMLPASVFQALMSLCSHISIHATTAQASPLINFALQFKKAYHNFPVSLASAPRAHKKGLFILNPSPWNYFSKGRYYLYPSSIKGLSAL